MDENKTNVAMAVAADKMGSDGSVEMFLFHIIKYCFYDTEIPNGDF